MSFVNIYNILKIVIKVGTNACQPIAALTSSRPLPVNFLFKEKECKSDRASECSVNGVLSKSTIKVLANL